MEYTKSINVTARQLTATEDQIASVQSKQYTPFEGGSLRNEGKNENGEDEFAVILSINSEHVKAFVGDWIVTYEDGKQEVVSNKQFEETFDQVHVVTDDDLVINPDMAEQGIKVGDEIVLGPELTPEEVAKITEEPVKEVAKEEKKAHTKAKKEK